MEDKLFQIKAILKAIIYGFGDSLNQRGVFRTDVQITQCKNRFCFDESLLKSKRLKKLKVSHDGAPSNLCIISIEIRVIAVFGGLVAKKAMDVGNVLVAPWMRSELA